MRISKQLLAGKLPLNALYTIPIKEIIYSGLWTPGDFVPNFSDNCLELYEYHVCHHVRYRWETTFIKKARDWRFSQILTSIKDKGFVVPLGAKIGFDEKHLVLVDGQHRLAAARGLDIDTVEVYIGDSSRAVEELRALDSNYWITGKIDSPWLDQHNIVI